MCLNMCIMKRTNYYFPEQMLERVKKACAILGIPMSEFIRRAVEAALKDAGL